MPLCCDSAISVDKPFNRGSYNNASASHIHKAPKLNTKKKEFPPSVVFRLFETNSRRLIQNWICNLP